MERPAGPCSTCHTTYALFISYRTMGIVMVWPALIAIDKRISAIDTWRCGELLLYKALDTALKVRRS